MYMEIGFALHICATYIIKYIRPFFITHLHGGKLIHRCVSIGICGEFKSSFYRISSQFFEKTSLDVADIIDISNFATSDYIEYIRRLAVNRRPLEINILPGASILTDTGFDVKTSSLFLSSLYSAGGISRCDNAACFVYLAREPRTRAWSRMYRFAEIGTISKKAEITENQRRGEGRFAVQCARWRSGTISWADRYKLIGRFASNRIFIRRRTERNWRNLPLRKACVEA